MSDIDVKALRELAAALPDALKFDCVSTMDNGRAMLHALGTQTTHAVASTGEQDLVLPGGRSRRTTNDVPVLELRQDLAEKVSASARAHIDPDQEAEYLVGTVCILDNPAPQDGVVQADVVFTIGGETLDEAAKSVVGRYELTYGAAAPSWVWSTNDDLAAVIASHYGCENRNLS